MVGELFAGLGAFKTMMDMTKTVQDAHDVATRDRAVIELQKEILSAQMQQATLIQRVSDLEKEMTRFEAWETEKKRYKLTDYGGGTFAYELKAEAAEGEPIHRICAACYQKGHKSILQNQGGNWEGRQKMRCVECSKDYFLGQYRPSAL